MLISSSLIMREMESCFLLERTVVFPPRNIETAKKEYKGNFVPIKYTPSYSTIIPIS